MPDSQADAVALLDQDGRLQISRDALSVAKAVQLRLTGIEADVAIDHIESDDATHHLLIDRARAAQFLQYHAADTGAVRVRPLTDRHLQVAPQHDLPFIDLFAGIGGSDGWLHVSPTGSTDVDDVDIRIFQHLVE